MPDDPAIRSNSAPDDLQKDKREQQARERNVIAVFWAVLVAGCLGIALFAVGSGQSTSRVFSIGFLMAGAAALLGGLLGFLFGLPRDAAAAGPTGSADPGKAANGAQEIEKTTGAHANNNLLEISDWLTKIIVGAGLVGLKDLVKWLIAVAQTVGTGAGLSDPSLARVFGGSILALFGSWGFLFVYIQTRTIISLIFARMQRSVIEVLGSKVRQAVRAEVRESVLPQLERTDSENSLLTKLYSADPDAPSEVIAGATWLLQQPQNARNARVLMYLACAYGQSHAKTQDESKRREISDKAYAALKGALEIDPSLEETVRGLLFEDDPAHLPGDDDLRSLATEARFRNLVSR